MSFFLSFFKIFYFVHTLLIKVTLEYIYGDLSGRLVACPVLRCESHCYGSLLACVHILRSFKRILHIRILICDIVIITPVYIRSHRNVYLVRVEMYGERKNLHVSESLLTSMESLLYLMRFTASLQTRALIMCHLQVFRRCVRIYL